MEGEERLVGDREWGACVRRGGEIVVSVLRLFSLTNCCACWLDQRPTKALISTSVSEASLVSLLPRDVCPLWEFPELLQRARIIPTQVCPLVNRASGEDLCNIHRLNPMAVFVKLMRCQRAAVAALLQSGVSLPELEDL